MKTREFFNKLEHARITAAIQAAELGTSGDIVLFISHRAVGDALAEAHATFTRLHLEKTERDNSLLLFIAPKSQTFAVVGGQALHEQVGQVWWDALLDSLGRNFRAGSYTDGLVAAIETAGHALRKHFPATGVDRTGQVDIVEE